MKTATNRRIRPNARQQLFAASALVAALVFVGSITSSPVYATDYPSYDDLANARSSETAKQAEVTHLHDLIAGLQAEVTATQTLAQQRWIENTAAQDALNRGTLRAEQLRLRATKAEAQAEQSHRQAAALVAQFARSAGNDLTVQLLISGDKSTDLLYQLGTTSKLSETARKIYDQAAQDTNTAQSLSDQADVAERELTTLAATVKTSLDQAITAQQQVKNALIEQESHQAEMAFQLQMLTDNREMTEQQYNDGVAAERQRQIAAAQAAEEAAHASGSGGGSGSAPLPPVSGAPAAPYDGNAVVAYAEQYVGVVPYGWGETPDDSFGCTGLTKWVYAHFGIYGLSRWVSGQTAAGVRVSASDAQAGDLVVWPNEHLGIYDGDGGVIHSPDWGRYVEHRHNLWGSYIFVRLVA